MRVMEVLQKVTDVMNLQLVVRKGGASLTTGDLRRCRVEKIFVSPLGLHLAPEEVIGADRAREDL